MAKQKRILVTPLNWGLGHASRCVPVVNELVKQNLEVIIGSNGDALTLLKEEFPNLRFVNIEGYPIKYSNYLPMSLSLLFQIPGLVKSIKKENNLIEKIVAEYDIDGIISDNRYGCFHSSVPSVIISHQLKIRVPFFSKLIDRKIAKLLSQFQACWVPDYENSPNLSGALSHGNTLLKNRLFIGPLSRFRNLEIETTADPIDLLIVLSGPEPNRSQFEKQIIKQLGGLNELKKVVLVRGLPDNHENIVIKPINVEQHNYLNHKELGKLICSSKMILCRSGYSSLMDLSVLGKKAIFIPTAGQTEQEYLAARMKNEGHFFSTKQKDFKLERDLKEATKYSGFQLPEKDVLKDVIQDFINEMT